MKNVLRLNLSPDGIPKCPKLNAKLPLELEYTNENRMKSRKSKKFAVVFENLAEESGGNTNE